MKRKAFIALAVVTVFSAGFLVGVLSTPNPLEYSQAYQVPTADDEPEKARPAVSELLKLTNAEREKAGVAALVLNPLLNESARLKAEEMERTGEFGHIGPNGQTSREYVDQVAACPNNATENLASRAEINNSKDTIDGWMNSTEGHKEALLNSGFSEVGFYVSEHYIVQHFCSTFL